jgi:Zn-dependent M28 family amino/carboxypeptidase
MRKLSFWRVVSALVIIGVLGIGGLGLIVSQPFSGAVANIPPHISAERLRQHVKVLSADLYPRSYDQPEKIARAGAYIADEFRSAGVDPVFQVVRVRGREYQNVIARFGPAEGPTLVVGAHYDSHGQAKAGGGFSPSSHTPGADDNASGVAGLIELAHYLGKHPPTKPVELVAYVLEEPPFFATDEMGSAWHARAMQVEQREIRLMISLEMIGFFKDEPGSQHFPVAGMSSLYPDRGNFAAVVGRVSDVPAVRRVKALMQGATDLPIYSINAPEAVKGIDFSDHRNYWRIGVPALMVTDTAFFRNPNYHEPEDTAETLDYERMAKVMQGVCVVVQQY